MSRNKPFVLQIIIVGGFILFLYIFFILATSVYRDYRLDVTIDKFQDEINQLAITADQKPKDVLYFQSKEFKDKYAKESLNLLNSGERLIIIPREDHIVKSEVFVDRLDKTNVLKLPNRNQWWEYFLGPTLSVKAPKDIPPSPEKPTDPAPEDAEPESVEEGEENQLLPIDVQG